MDLSRNQFLKLLVVVGTPGALVAACSSSSTSGTPADAGGSSGASGTSGTSGASGTSGTSGSSGSSGTSGTSGSSGGLDASDIVDANEEPHVVSCDANGATASNITLNHGHVLHVPAADFADGLDHQYDIRGLALHTHTVSLTAANLTTIHGGGKVTVTSSLTVHAHDVTVTCA